MPTSYTGQASICPMEFEFHPSARSKFFRPTLGGMHYRQNLHFVRFDPVGHDVVVWVDDQFASAFASSGSADIREIYQ